MKFIINCLPIEDMKSAIVLTILYIFCIEVTAQTSAARWPSKELALTVDNDYPYMTDQYYTAGQDLSYRFLLNSKIPFLPSSDSSKTIFSLHFGNKVFTPKNVDTPDVHYMDRPYCGWNFISAELLHFKQINAGNLFALQVGVVGADSGMGQLQQWWHKAIKLYSIEGWNSQISNEVVVNASFNHAHGFKLMNGVEFVSNSGGVLGTGNNKLSQEFTLRLFRFNPLSQSSFMNANLSNGSSKNRSELFLYTSLGGECVMSNIFIEGSLFKSNPSAFTTSINPWFFTQKIGVQYSNRKISFGFAMIHLSKETELVSTHNYASASLAYRM